MDFKIHQYNDCVSFQVALKAPTEISCLLLSIENLLILTKIEPINDRKITSETRVGQRGGKVSKLKSILGHDPSEIAS